MRLFLDSAVQPRGLRVCVAVVPAAIRPFRFNTAGVFLKQSPNPRIAEISGDHNSGFLRSGRHYEGGIREFLRPLGEPGALMSAVQLIGSPGSPFWREKGCD